MHNIIKYRLLRPSIQMLVSIHVSFNFWCLWFQAIPEICHLGLSSKMCWKNQLNNTCFKPPMKKQSAFSTFLMFHHFPDLPSPIFSLIQWSSMILPLQFIRCTYLTISYCDSFDDMPNYIPILCLTTGLSETKLPLRPVICHHFLS